VFFELRLAAKNLEEYMNKVKPEAAYFILLKASEQQLS
jgi:hypothetical protein